MDNNNMDNFWLQQKKLGLIDQIDSWVLLQLGSGPEPSHGNITFHLTLSLSTLINQDDLVYAIEIALDGL
jgi:hypothetical protein